MTTTAGALTAAGDAVVGQDLCLRHLHVPWLTNLDGHPPPLPRHPVDGVLSA